jgi:hypothetical protein
MSGRPNLSVDSKRLELLIRPLDRTQIFTGVSKGCWPWCSYGMTTRWRGCLVGQTWVWAGHNFWSDHWILFKFLKVMALLSQYSSLTDHTSSSPCFHSIATPRKQPPKTPVKIWARSNGWIKSYGLFELILKFARPDILVT